MPPRSRMASRTRARLSREKDDADVIEHVIEGVQLDAAPDTARVTDLGVQPSLGGLVVSAVQVRIRKLKGDDSEK